MRIGGMYSGMDTDQMVKDLMKAERMKVDRFHVDRTELEWKQEEYNNINKAMANFILNTRKEFGIGSGFASGNVSNFNWVKTANVADKNVLSASVRGNAIEGSHEVEVKELASVARATTKDLDDLLDENGKVKADKAGKVKITTKHGEANLEIEEGDRMSDVVRKINALEDDGGNNLGLRASYDSNLNRMMIMTRNSGKEESIKFEEVDDGNLGESLFGASHDILGDGVKGTNAKLKFNGDEIEQDNNLVSVFGMDLQLRSIGTTTIGVDTDVDGIYNKIENFVNEYNELVDKMSGVTSQEYHRDYRPLTDEQKMAMSDDDIEKWEEKARSGLLRGDRTINSTRQNMRSSMYLPVNDTIGEYSHITEIGITTGSYQDGGKLVIEEDKLRDAIANDPEGVLDLFFKSSPDGEKGSTGIVQRAYDDVTAGMKDIIRQAGPGENASLYRDVRSNIMIDFVTSQGSISRLDRDVMGIQERIAREEQRLIRVEDRHWAQFTAMEKAMQRMHSQSEWLQQQLMGM